MGVFEIFEISFYICVYNLLSVLDRKKLFLAAAQRSYYVILKGSMQLLAIAVPTTAKIIRCATARNLYNGYPTFIGKNQCPITICLYRQRKTNHIIAETRNIVNPVNMVIRDIE